MHNIAKGSAGDRTQLFEVAADRMQIPPALIEKDFWVCWLLDMLFASEQWGRRLIFKGGTCLSKVFRLIDRFSEDIDLILDWGLINMTRDAAWQERSRTQRDLFGKETNRAAAAFLGSEFVPWLSGEIDKRGITGAAVSVDEKERLCINVAYPALYPPGYLQPKIRLEIGPLADWVPHGDFTIRSYAAEYAPDAMQKPECRVRAILAERSFWEKATILHREAHRAPEKTLPPRQARHYYDMAMMAKNPVKDRALADLKLLSDVVAFKRQFYPCPWARYENAKPGGLRLVPDDHALKELEDDYDAMRNMIFNEAPPFGEIVSGLKDLETEING
jgi:hypothetical protein